MSAKIIQFPGVVVRYHTKDANRASLKEDVLAARKSLARPGKLRLVINLSDAQADALAKMELGSTAENVHELINTLIADETAGLAASIYVTGRELTEVGSSLMLPFQGGKANRRGLNSLDLDGQLERLEELGKRARRLRRKLAEHRAPEDE